LFQQLYLCCDNCENNLLIFANKIDPGHKWQVLVTLRFLASGSFLEVIGDTFLSYDKSTVSRVVRRVTLALASKVNNFVKFPTTPNERDEIKHGLFRVGSFSSVIGNFFTRMTIQCSYHNIASKPGA